MKPLTKEELKALPAGEYFWLVELNGMYVRKVGCTEEYIVVDAMPVFDEFKFTDYGKTWLAYKNKEQAEAKGEIVELPCIRIVDKGVRGVLYEVVSVQFSGTVQSETFSKLESARERLAELKGDAQ